MKRARFTKEQIIGVLKEQEAGIARVAGVKKPRFLGGVACGVVGPGVRRGNAKPKLTAFAKSLRWLWA